MVRVVVAIVLVAACSTEEPAAPVWQVPVDFAPDAPFDGYGVPVPDGYIVHLPNALAFELAGRALTGPHLVRLDRDGAVVATMPTPANIGVTRWLRADADGNIVFEQISDGGIVELLAYTRELQPRWRVVVEGFADFAVAADGHVAVGEEQRVRLLAPDGRERWSVPSTLYNVAFAASGDVISQGQALRRQHAAADGSVVTEAPIAFESAHLFDDGSVLDAAYVDGGPTAADDGYRLTRYDASLAVRWTQSEIVHDIPRPLGSSGMLAAVSFVGGELVDDATGEISRLALATTGRLVDLDATGYIVVGFEAGDGIVRYAR